MEGMWFSLVVLQEHFSVACQGIANTVMSISVHGHGTELRVAHTWLYCVLSAIGPFAICTILSHLYCYYSSLLKAAEKLASPCNVLKDDDTESYRRMCTTTLVASRKQGIFDSKNDTFGDPIQVLSVNDIIGKVTEVLFMNIKDVISTIHLAWSCQTCKGLKAKLVFPNKDMYVCSLSNPGRCTVQRLESIPRAACLLCELLHVQL